MSMTESFVDEVKALLENLYDFPFLQKHAQGDAQQTRREILDAIETLNPGSEVFFRSPHARLYNLLHLHYVEGMTIQEVAHDLGISTRQAYRDLRRGQENIAQLLWGRWSKTPAKSDPIAQEIERLDRTVEAASITELVQAAYHAVERLAAAQGVGLQIRLPDDALIIPTMPVIARQIFINLLSHIVQTTAQTTLQIALAHHPTDSDAFTLDINSAPPAFKPILLQMVAHIGWELRAKPDQSATHLVGHTRGATVLVIDDNEGLIELLERYLSGQHVKVISATTGSDGLQLATEYPPDAIIMDVMMPGMDGWELLQRLRAAPPTASLPIIICSMLNDPELAFSLGATAVLTKPVTREAVIDALQGLVG